MGSYEPAELLEHFYEHLCATRSQSTADIYKRGATKFCDFVQKQRYRLGALPKNVMSEWIAHLISIDKLRPRSVYIYCQSVCRFLKYIKGCGVSIPELDDPILPRVKTSIQLILSESQLDAFIDKCKAVPEPYSSFMQLLALSTLRISEMCKLKVSDIITSEYGVILVISDEAKGGARRVPTPRKFSPILKSYLQFHRAKVSKMLRTLWLFPALRDPKQHIKPKDVREYFRKVRKELSLPTLTPHTLRRTQLTLMYQSGINPITLQKIAGHRNLATTSIYIIPKEEVLFEAVNKPFDRKIEETTNESRT